MSGKKKLIEILDDNQIIECLGSTNVEIGDLHLDSRRVCKGDLYFAVSGYVADGHDFIGAAIDNGAVAIVCERRPIDLKSSVTLVIVKDVRATMAYAAKMYYDDASTSLRLVGVTGTNGKTTVATSLYQLFTALGYKVGLISTVENIIGEVIIPSTHTTPDVISLHKLIWEMSEAGCSYVFMEVSSHAIHQERIAGLEFDGGIFTNMSHDHLDYHKSFKEYIWAKKKFFDNLPKDAFSLVNIDDKRGEVMVQNTRSRILTYALKQMAKYKAKIINNSIDGLHLTIDGFDAYFRLVGEFNAYNLLAVYGGAVALGMEGSEVLQRLTDIRGAEGRFESVKVSGVSKVGIVDYAHTPDALENVLSTISKVKSKQTKVITVVGCGGDRDAAKRPLMAHIAAKMSDRVILTSDNPRTEDPELILDQMVAGLEDDQLRQMLRIADRAEAIKTAVMIAKDNDVILVAGKGHEKYQEINGKKFPFDDKEVLKAAMLSST